MIKFALLSLILLTASPAFAATNCFRVVSLSKVQRDFGEVFNALRRDHGLSDLKESLRLTKIAADYACLLARTDHFDHVGPDGSTLETRAEVGKYRFCTIAENLAKGQSDVTEVLKAWRRSPGHYRNLIHDGVDEFGLAIAVNPAPDAREDAPRSLSELATQIETKRNLLALGGIPEGSIVWVLLVGRDC